jgi:hypothetical protein
MNAIRETCPLCGGWHQGTACHQQVGIQAPTALTTPQPEASDREIAVKILDGLYCWSVGPRDDDGFRSAAENDNIVSDTEAVIVTIRADERRKSDKYEKALDDIANTPTSDIGDSIDYATWARDTAKSAILGETTP